MSTIAPSKSMKMDGVVWFHAMWCKTSFSGSFEVNILQERWDIYRTSCLLFPSVPQEEPCGPFSELAFLPRDSNVAFIHVISLRFSLSLASLHVMSWCHVISRHVYFMQCHLSAVICFSFTACHVMLSFQPFPIHVHVHVIDPLT